MNGWKTLVLASSLTIQGDPATFNVRDWVYHRSVCLVDLRGDCLQRTESELGKPGGKQRVQKLIALITPILGGGSPQARVEFRNLAVGYGS